MTNVSPLRVVQQTETKPQRFVFVLLNNFTMLCFSCALESLRIANRMSERPLYEWILVGEGGETVNCSAGTSFALDGDLGELQRDDIVLVCGGIDVQASTTRKMLNWLRREARRGLTLGGLCTAGYTLAKAGLLEGRKATIHWENQDSFTEEFPDVELTRSVFVHDGNRMTTAGGHIIHRPYVEAHRRPAWRRAGNIGCRSVNLRLHSDWSGHPKAIDSDQDWRPPSEIIQCYPDDGSKH